MSILNPLPATTISVVIPLYNHAHYIEAALESVLSQTSAADEIILIDDGSSDDGYEIAQRVLAKAPNAKTYKQENAGAHHTLNRAIALSHGEYIAVLNSDDLFALAKLERCRAIIQQRPDIGLISGDLQLIDHAGVRQDSGFAVEWLGRARRFLDETHLPQLALLNDNFVATTSNMVFSRALWDASGGFQPLRYCHDLDFLMFACRHSTVFLDLQFEHIAYRVHQNNTIREAQGRVRVEVAAVIAQALFASGPRLFLDNAGEPALAAFQRCLRNRQMTELVCFFQTLLGGFASRTDFYRYATDPSHASMFAAAATSGR
ncbi:glycosyltransferase family A protein [Paraburkholderia sp. DHOC27]|uniref:glycosyltransferase family 2 protein n=1 Tax=Paraburkholderia sp. DHOC27 TaxID=2303330 RepID=UPI0015F32C3A|nr:glycosyltransferase family A protein [Paraburkholderia sp. DHOC27]